MRRAFLLTCGAVFGMTQLAAAQATPNVPLSATVYRDLDRLAGAGLISDMVVGARPYSRREVARLLHQAQRNLGRLEEGSGWAARAVESDLERYEDMPTTPLEEVVLDVSVLASPARPIPADSNGRIDALVQPLTDFQDGRRYRDGATAAAEGRFIALIGRYIALSAQPRAVAVRERGRGTIVPTLSLQSGSASLLFGNLSIGVGREEQAFGQAPGGGLLLSRNAPPLDVVRLSNDQPARLPWIFGLLGPLRASLLVADLGPHQIFPHSKLIGYQLNAAVTPRFELGVQVIDEMGGQGAPGAILRNRLYDATVLVDALNTSTDFLFSNKLAGMNFRWRVPALYGFELYADGAVDDLDPRRWKSTFLEDGGYIAGFSFTCLLECGTLPIRAEYHQTGIRYYTHDQFRTGIAEDQFVLGDPLGPRGLGTYLTVEHSGPRVGTLTLAAALEVRSGNRYASAITGAQEVGFHFVLLERHPGEHRTRLAATWRTPDYHRRSTLFATVGAEHVENFGFVGGQSRNNGLMRVGMELRP